MLPFLRSRRRRWLVDRNFQFRFVLVVFAYTMVVVGSAAVLAFVQNLRMSDRLLEFIRRQDAPMFVDSVTAPARAYVAVLVVLSLMSAGAVILFGLYASNRLAGPVIRLRRMLDEVAHGNLSQRAAFRERDRLDELAQEWNRRVAELHEAQNRLKADMPFLVSSVVLFRSDAESGKLPLDPDELRRLETTFRTLADSWRGQGAPEAS